MTSVMKSEKTKKKDWSNKKFSNSEKNIILEKLVTARVGLLLRHPFFGNMAMRLKLVDASDWCPTLATDGRNFYYNNGFVDQLSPKECEFGFAHEVLHNVFDHLGRKKDRDSVLSNVAADYAVNQILKDEKIGTSPKFIDIYQDNKYRGWSYEKIYEELYNNAEKIDIGALGELLDEHLDEPGDNSDSSGNSDGDTGKSGRPQSMTAEERKKIRDEIKEAVISAAKSAGTGKVPAAVQRLISDLTEPKLNWRELIRMRIQSIVKQDFSFQRFNKKSQFSGTVLPGMLNNESIDVCCSIDMSGSISQAQAKDFISEVKGIMEEFQEFKLRLWCFDTAVYADQEFTNDNLDEINNYVPVGGGGTDFTCNFEYMKNNDITPKKFIMFTDGLPYGSWGDEDYTETLFVIHGSDSIIPPYGEVTYYK
jgi:predicted metal-dependent peptidase